MLYQTALFLLAAHSAYAQTGQDVLNSFYAGCLSNAESCLGSSNTTENSRICTTSSNCEAAVYFTKVDDKYQFKAITTYDYVAFGFSNDTKMDYDGTVVCLKAALGTPSLDVYRAWNKGHSNIRTTDQSGLTKNLKTVTDDVLYCEVTLDIVTNYDNIFTIDLNKEGGHILLLASGPVSDDTLRHHNTRSMTDQAVFGGVAIFRPFAALSVACIAVLLQLL